MANAKKEGPTSQQLERQKLASKDQNLRASVNKGKPNQEAIKSFNKTEGAGQGKGAQGLEAAGGAAGAGAGNKPGNVAERNRQGAGAGSKPERTRTGKLERTGENKPGKMAEHSGREQERMPETAGNKHEGENLHGNNHNVEGNQAKVRKQRSPTRRRDSRADMR